MASSSTNDDREAALSLAEQAEAEAEAAEAEAATARARAAELRTARTAEADAASEDTEDTGGSEAAESEAVEPTDAEDVEPPAQRRKWVPAWPVLAVAASVVVVCGLLATSGYMLWSSQQAAAQRSAEAEYAAAARQGVINLMSLDFNKGEADLQRLIDSTTGEFRADFEASKDDFITVMNESQVITEANVRATAVEETSEDTATVLVAATSQVTNSAGAEQQPRAWRLSIDVARDNGQVKMSKVEFVP